MIKRFIIKTNEWYENLPNNKGGIFYISLLLIPYILILLITPYIILPLCWILIVAIWRVTYSLIIEIDEIKKNKKDNI